MKIEDHLIGPRNPKSTAGNIPPGNFYKDLFKNWILGLEKQISKKSTKSDFLTSQFVNTPCDATS